MPDSSDTTLAQFDALNTWLGDVYGEGIGFATLLLGAGFSEAEIEQIKREHLSELLQAVLDLLESYNDFSNNGRYIVMLWRYGLLDGKPQTLHEIGQNVGIARERIHQLVNRRLDLYRAPERQAQFRQDFAAIGRRLLDSESDGQG